jgi:hypothetical protein
MLISGAHAFLECAHQVVKTKMTTIWPDEGGGRGLPLTISTPARDGHALAAGASSSLFASLSGFAL